VQRIVASLSFPGVYVSVYTPAGEEAASEGLLPPFCGLLLNSPLTGPCRSWHSRFAVAVGKEAVGVVVGRCPAGLVCVAAPVAVAGRCCLVVEAGRVFDARPDVGRIVPMARIAGVDAAVAAFAASRCLVWDSDEIGKLSSLVSFVAAEVVREEELRRRAAELGVLADLSIAVAGSLGAKQAAGHLLKMVAEFTGASGGALYVGGGRRADLPSPAAKVGVLAGDLVSVCLGPEGRGAGELVLSFAPGSEGVSKEFLKVAGTMLSLSMSNAKFARSLRRSYLWGVRALVGALDAKDSQVRRHSARVASLAYRTARAMGLERPEATEVYVAGLLHDVGKLAINGTVLRNPGRLTPQEKRVIEEHPVKAARVLRAAGFGQRLVDMVLYHHENWDGTGYPQRLAGDVIPVGARVLRVADAYEAMTSDRPYRSALGHAYAADELRRCSGREFDPRVVEALLGVVGRSTRAQSVAST